MSGVFDKKKKTDFTMKQKLDEIERIITSRKKRYPAHVTKKQMAKRVAIKRIDVLRAIARDYRDAIHRNQGE
jgi:hypothetical protein